LLSSRRPCALLFPYTTLFRSNSCLGAPVWEIGLHDNVDHAPCVIGLIPGHLAADGLAYLRVRTVAAHNILGTNDALVAFSVFYRDSNWALPFFAYFEANESPAVIRGDSRGALLGKAGKVIQNACLVHNQEQKGRD